MRKKLKDLIEDINSKRSEIKKINLSGQYKLELVPKEIEYCENLESIDISFTAIKMIPDFIFQLPKLKRISYLGCNALITNPTGYKYAENLETIEIYIPKSLKQIPEDIYKLSKIKSLTVQGDIDAWEDGICRIESLEELNSYDTKIHDLPDTIDRLKLLKKVSFWQPLFSDTAPIVLLNLDEIFHKLSKCDSLKILELNKNGLTKIPESIGQLRSLRKFSAEDNKLTEIPVELYELMNLKELDLGVNQIHNIPKGIGKLVNLKVLKLNSNWKNMLNTENLFDEIDKLVNLENLELWSCESQINISDKITNLMKLKFLDVNNNSVCASTEVFSFLDRIKKFRC